MRSQRGAPAPDPVPHAGSYLLMISGPLMTVMWAPISLAMARPIIVFPVPGGPYRRTPLGGGIPVCK